MSVPPRRRMRSMPSKRSNPKAYLFHIRDNISLARRFVGAFDYERFRDNQLVFYAVTRALEIISEALGSPSLRSTGTESRLIRRCAVIWIASLARNDGHWISSGCGTDTGGQRSCHREGNVQHRQRPFDFGVETFRRPGRLGEIVVASQ